MFRRLPAFLLLSVLVVFTACTNKKVTNPIANVDSKQPDKVLFDKAMDALKHNRFDVARITLQTLINTYPDSEFLARAKLSLADSWYAEGGSGALAQAESEYNDFETFFPNLPEAAEAQLKIGNIHYQQMEKPDRDYTHALRAENEYRKLILQWPDSKLVPEAKQRLLEVQEVIAEREYRVGRFYYLRGSFPAAIARLQSLIDRYPLYSQADEALYLLGQSYEGEIALIRERPMPEVAKARMIADLTKSAADAYSRILTRYPVMDRAVDAKARLTALHQPVPRPTRAAVAQNKAEEQSRRETSMLTKVMRTFNKHPDVAQAARVGEPPLVDPKLVNASDVVKKVASAAMGTTAEKGAVSGEVVGTGAPPPNQAPPRSDAPPAPDSTAPADAQPNSNELVPNVAANPSDQKANSAPDPSELKPNIDSGTEPAPAPPQVNEIQQGAPDPNASRAGASTPSNASAASAEATDEEIATSSSKHKKKKGLRKIVPF